jgi:hypothetical protein
LEGSSKKLDDLQQKVKTLEAHTAEELGIIRKQLEDVSRSIKPIQKRAASVGPQVGQDTVSK